MEFKNLKPLDVAKYVFQCYREQDFSQFDKITHPECRWFFPGKIGIIPWAGEFKGMEILNFVEIIRQNLSFDYYEDKTYYEDGNTVITLCEEVFTVKSTGNKVLNKLAGFFEIEEGKIIRYFEYGDTGAMERGYTG